MQLLPLLQHFQKLSHPPFPRLGLLGGLEAPQDGVAVGAVQGGEKGFRLGVAVQLRLEVARHRRTLLPVVRRLPPAVALGLLDLLPPGRLHPAALDERLDSLPVDLRPDAPRPTRRELLQPGRGVPALLLPVDPPIAEGDLECLVVGRRLPLGVLLRQPQPDAGGGGVVLVQPGGPDLGVLEEEDGEVGFGGGRGAHGVFSWLVTGPHYPTHGREGDGTRETQPPARSGLAMRVCVRVATATKT